MASGNRWADYESVDNRNGIQETGANVDRESVLSALFRSESKEKRDRDQNVLRTLRDRENHKILERKVDLVVRGERMAQQKLYEAETEVEARNWEKRNSDIAFQEINQEFEPQRFQQHQASRWADQAQRDKISLYGEFELRNRLFQENHARDCQEIEECSLIARQALRTCRSSLLSFQGYPPILKAFRLLHRHHRTR